MESKHTSPGAVTSQHSNAVPTDSGIPHPTGPDTVTATESCDECAESHPTSAGAENTQTPNVVPTGKASNHPQPSQAEPKGETSVPQVSHGANTESDFAFTKSSPDAPTDSSTGHNMPTKTPTQGEDSPATHGEDSSGKTTTMTPHTSGSLSTLTLQSSSVSQSVPTVDVFTLQDGSASQHEILAWTLVLGAFLYFS